MTDRRAFLKVLARTAAYAAPVVMSYAVPAPLAGQSSVHHPKSAAVETDPTSPYSPPPGRREPTPLP